MIIEYHRPETLEQAKKLLDRKSPATIPLGGGTNVSQTTEEPVAVVDLQSLGLDGISFEKSTVKIGSMARLQTLVENTSLPVGLSKSARRETNINIRRAATTGGMLVTSDGRSPLLCCLLALDVKIFWEPGKKSLFLTEWLSKDRQKNPGKLITGIEFNTPVDVYYEDIARSPEDRPIVFVAVAKWDTGETRIVIGGAGKSPVVISDGSNNLISQIFDRHNNTSVMEESGYNAYQQAAIQNLIERIVPHKSIFGRKGDQ
jgi:CO/xanthine dehydrogenase FAD-binding subunit